jgi:hypothetical protein
MCNVKCVKSRTSAGALLHVSTLKLKPRISVQAKRFFKGRERRERECTPARTYTHTHTVVFKLVINFVFQVFPVFVPNSFP